MLRRNSFLQFVLFFPACLLFAPTIYADVEGCEPASYPSDPVLIDSATRKLEWRRAIDQDKAEDLWRLLPHTDVREVNDKGKTALMAAAKMGDDCLFSTLLDKGLKVEHRSFTGGTVLMYAVLGNEAEMIKTVLPMTTNIDAQSTNGWTAVMIAAAKGFDEAIKLLLDAGANAGLADVYQWSPLMRAIDNRHAQVVEILLADESLNVNHTNENGSSALHIAASSGDISAASKLIQLGADVNVQDKNNYSAGQIAREKGYAELASVLEQI